MSISLENVSVQFGELHVLNNISMSFPEGKISVVLGPSGCGKTTILNLITSMTVPESGRVSVKKGRKFSYLFQEPRLLPWLTVEGNLRFVLDEAGSSKKREDLIGRFLDMTGLRQYSSLYPAELSGGMRQRVAIARAFAHPSDIILMDEPFQGLDLKLKLSLIDQFTELWREEKRTAILVTHDFHEAVKLADKIYVLSEKPARLVDRFSIEEPREKRIPGSSEYLQHESRLYQALIE